MANTLLIKSFGTILTDNQSVKDDSMLFKSSPVDYNLKLPQTFDGSYVWRYYITPVTFQGYCGNCWAIASTRVLADRFSIISKNYIKPYLSSTAVTICDGILSDRPTTDPNSISQQNITKHTKNSCFGNSINNALKFLYVYGTIDADCFNYGMLLDKGINIKLSQVQSASDLPNCQDIVGKNFETCVDDVKIAAQYYRASTFYKLDQDEEKIKQDIYKFGPAISGFIMYDDFLNEYDGLSIYMGPKEGAKPTGGHAISIYGWGEETIKNKDGKDELVKYWIIANSWGRNWGNDGYFKMKIGIKECKLEENFYGCLPDIPFIENPYMSELDVREAELILERKKFDLDPLNGYLKSVIPRIKNGELIGNLDPIFPEVLGYNLKDFVAGKVPLFPVVFDTMAILPHKGYPYLKYIIIFVLTFILTTLVSYFIIKFIIDNI